MTASYLGDLPPSALQRYGRELLDWISAYLSDPERYPVLARVRPGDVTAALSPSPPVRGESLADILADAERVLLPGVTHWNHPGFFAYFAISSSVPGLLGEMLAAALNVNAMIWTAAPSATELERVALDWLRQLLGMGPGWFGLIHDTASVSTLVALTAAREADPALAVRERGMAGRADLPPLRVYCSEHAHSSVDKAAITLGIGHANVVKVPADDAFRLRPDLLAAAMDDDVARGMRPVAVVATTGTTGTTSVDPVRAVAAVCRARGAWLHVDGAYGGAAAVVPELRGVLDGVELADSLVVNPHKWLFTPLDCSVLYTRRPDVLRRAFSLVPEYLVTHVPAADGGEAEGGEAARVDLMDYGVQLGRRFRALKLWMVLRAFGAEGLAERLRYHVQLAQTFAAWVAAEPGWEVSAPHPLSLVCFRHAPPGVDPEAQDAANARILAAVNAGGEVFLSHTRLRGRYVLRLAVGNIRTEERHVARAWELLRQAARSL
ncbi:aromatic-L-amino-acid decarboxylase [Gemmatimonadetes bacterium T265]|nr:aromatic-L-amino-acid decarboxylase [Gemmatimonadetes bacterium T265]